MNGAIFILGNFNSILEKKEFFRALDERIEISFVLFPHDEPLQSGDYQYQLSYFSRRLCVLQ